MDIQAKINNLREWFMRIIGDGQKPYWILYKHTGGIAKGIKISQYVAPSPEAAWNQLEQDINLAYTNGERRFNVEVAKGGIKDPNKLLYPGGLDFGGGYVLQGGGLYGVPGGQQQQMPPGVYGPEFINSMLEKHKLEIQQVKNDLKHDQQLKELKEQLAAIQQAKKSFADQAMDFIERLLDGLNNPHVANTIVGIITAAKTGNSAALVQGIAGAGKVVRRQMAPPEPAAPEAHPDAPGGTEFETVHPDDDDDDHDMEQACDAVDLLRAKGIENPGGKIKTVAEFYAANPEMVESILQSIQQQPEA